MLRWLDLALNANLMLTNSFLATNGNGNGKGHTECAVQKEVGSAGGGGGGVHARNIHSVGLGCLTKPCDVAISQASIGLATVTPLPTPLQLPLGQLLAVHPGAAYADCAATDKRTSHVSSGHQRLSPFAFVD